MESGREKGSSFVSQNEPPVLRQQVPQFYDAPFRDGESSGSGVRAEEDEVGAAEATAGPSGAVVQVPDLFRDPRWKYSRSGPGEEGVLDEKEAEAGDPGTKVPDLEGNEAGCSHDEPDVQGGRYPGPYPLEIKFGSSTSEQSGVDVVVHEVPRRKSSPPAASAKSLKLSPTLEYLSALAHLTTFGILGVCIRYGLEILFSTDAYVTAENSPLFIDLPANMLGCFFMGWVGVVLKKDIANFSELLAIGLSTGLMGSITTYASWNESMLKLMTNGLYVRAVVGILIGLELSQMSLTVGMDSAKLLKSSFTYIERKRGQRDSRKFGNTSSGNLKRRKLGLLVFLTLSILLWVAALVLTVIDTRSSKRRKLWLACVVGPPGVWARWLLARLNGQGIGRKKRLRWLPVGTLLTNFVASTLEGILETVIVVSPEDATLLASGLQVGLLGCMSTVSTFVVELHALHQSPQRWRAYAYAGITIFCTMSMGALVFTLPVLIHD